MRCGTSSRSWTLAASIEMRTGHRAVQDRGASADLASALAAAAADHVAELRRRLPRARILLQLDEPMLPAVAAGSLPTVSGLAGLPPWRLRCCWSSAGPGDGGDPRRGRAAARPLLRGASPPVELIRRSGAAAMAVDFALLSVRGGGAIAAAVEAGVAVLLGAVPTSAPADVSAVGATVSAVQGWWSRLGFAAAELPRSVSVSPACGLASSTPAAAQSILGRCQAVARALREEGPDGSESA